MLTAGKTARSCVSNAHVRHIARQDAEKRWVQNGFDFGDGKPLTHKLAIVMTLLIPVGNGRDF
ncbi:hypothetical protein [Acinetobacter guillouiae]|uniref:hypothetical protein n=1 Tax=Acinetobacter guillouiae TaxID=106649 RepID=UPI0028EE3C27|nr:hypothetical protein [Acinetobacter guillouiae]